MITIAFGMISVIALGTGICLLNMNGRIERLEKEIRTMNQVKKLGDMKLPDVKEYADQIEEELIAYNKSFGNPEYTEWIDKDYDSKGVK